MLVYLLENKINGKKYIGQAKDLNKRLVQHKSSALKGSKYILHKAIRKYGISNFVIKILQKNIQISKINKCEQKWIKKLNTYFKNGFGYNMTLGGEGFKGHHSEKTKKIITQKQIGRKLSVQWKENISNGLKGIPKTKQHNKNVSLSKIGIPRLDQTKNKLSKKWLITFPNGYEKLILNLSKFCKENNLQTSNMQKVAYGERPQHKNFGCKLISKKTSKIKIYIIKLPSGKNIKVINLKKFCKDKNIIYGNLLQRKQVNNYKIIKKL